MIRALTARFVLGTLLVATLCLISDPAQAGPFLRRGAANNNAACCPQTYGGYGSGGYGYGGYSAAPTQSYPITTVGYAEAMPGAVGAPIGAPIATGGYG